MSETKTFRGLSLAEVEAKVRAELGDDAVVVRQREGLSGGVGGFFQKRLYEVDAVPGDATAPAEPAAEPTPDIREDFLSQLKAAMSPEVEQAAAEQAAARAAADFVPHDLIPATPPATNGNAAALAAMFAPDAPREPVAWPEPELEGEPEILPPAPIAPASLPVPAASTEVAAQWPAGAKRLQARLADRGVSAELGTAVLDEPVPTLLPFSSQGRLKPLVASALARRIPV